MGNHYYDSQGNARHDAKMKEVRDENLLISVTTFLGMLDKPGLNKWKNNELINEAFDLLSKGFNPSDKESLRKAVYQNFKDHNKAAEIGTAVHSILEQLIKEQPKGFAVKDFFDAYADDLAKPLYESVKMAYDWHCSVTDQIGSLEETVVNLEDGYAGQLDFFGTMKTPSGEIKPGIVDWKTQSLKDPGFGKRDPTKRLKVKINKYDTWPMQMGAYAKCKKASHSYIGVISSNPDFQYFEAIPYDGKQLVDSYKVFKKLVEAFQALNKIERS